MVGKSREDHLSEIGLKRVYDAPEPDDGARVLVDRLWPRGMRKDALKMDLWLKDVAPSPDLRHWFGHDPDRWAEFRTRYRQELEAGNPDIARLVALAAGEKVTLLYAAHDEAHNHALVLRDFLRRA
ncbi:DUF488 domain-containing protein [Gluconacetobacter sacchari]|uniref:DUF488 domain-containing protein n=2 Tax=Gluconacetobacter sacchari TaxID=92759 RepID=A0A7W4NRS6_9PROT|nr:DUF488 domain-containing protein [Gluconacetobacter sacchari]MBB2161293.1 DUF488 domain-containing protein [Gluconacetobacter sacchari]GBQ23627.1 hypothetical protein AA12717_1546 [Gluconacetobacter sacchari DSM 12717]